MVIETWLEDMHYSAKLKRIVSELGLVHRIEDYTRYISN